MSNKVTAKCEVALPARVLWALCCAKPGYHLCIEEGADGRLLRARAVVQARLAQLHAKIRRGCGTADFDAFRDEPRGTGLRD